MAFDFDCFIPDTQHENLNNLEKQNFCNATYIFIWRHVRDSVSQIIPTARLIVINKIIQQFGVFQRLRPQFLFIWWTIITFLAFNPKRCILRTILTILAIVIAESVPRFDLVMSLIGGTLTGPLVFILPPMMYVKIMSLERRSEEPSTMESFTNIVFTKIQEAKVTPTYTETTFRPKLPNFKDRFNSCLLSRYIETGLCYFIVIASVVLTLSTTYFNVISAISYSDFSKPCIYNISTSLLYS